MTDLSMTRGDTAEFTLTLTESGDPFDLTGSDITFTAKREITDADVDAVIVKTSGAGIASASPATGVATLTIDPADTEDLEGGTILVWDVQVERAGDVRTPLSGHLHIVGDVTQTATGS